MEEVCRNLRTPYFTISISKSNTPLYGRTNSSCQLSIPASFIKEHGDKIQLCVTLQAVASGRVWPVKLWASAAHGKVLITSGWKAFASSNELEQGDHLILSLTAMSQFVVYIFKVAGTLKEPRCSITSYKPCNKCQDSKAWHDLWKTSEKSRNNQSEEATSDHQGFLDKRKTFSRLSYHTEQPASRRLSKRALVECGREERAISSGSKDPSQQLSKVQRMSFQRSSAVTGAGFLKKLTITHMQGPLGYPNGARLVHLSHLNSYILTACSQCAQILDSSSFGDPFIICKLTLQELPCDFLRLHGHQLREVVKLQGPYQVAAVKYRVFTSSLRAYFVGTGWRQFLNRNSLKVGDELLFTLVATSCFAVKSM